jgi:hypothetical protein
MADCDGTMTNSVLVTGEGAVMFNTSHALPPIETCMFSLAAFVSTFDTSMRSVPVDENL